MYLPDSPGKAGRSCVESGVRSWLQTRITALGAATQCSDLIRRLVGHESGMQYCEMKKLSLANCTQGPSASGMSLPRAI